MNFINARQLPGKQHHRLLILLSYAQLVTTNFLSRVDELKVYKEKHDHLNM